VEFEKAVDADAAANNRTLTVNATTTKFDANVGQVQGLASLTTDAAGTTTLQGQHQRQPGGLQGGSDPGGERDGAEE